MADSICKAVSNAVICLLFVIEDPFVVRNPLSRWLHEKVICGVHIWNLFLLG